MRVIISSAGRRVYLIQWFQQALAEAQLDGQVYVLDHAPEAAAAAAADGYRHMPRFTSPEYPRRLLEVVDELQPDLFISLNDYELTALSQGLSDQLASRGVVVPSLTAAAHRSVADKLAMSHALEAAGIPTPKTLPLSATAAVHRMLDTVPAVIIKDRWGSGSSGLRRCTAEAARRWMTGHYTSAVDDDAVGFDELIIQPDVGGTEHGLDIIAPVRGGPVAGVLARQKLGMRHGETSSAVTVDNAPFMGVAATLNAVLGIQGTIDVDVMLTDDGVAQVIDINPRFGGGYPFSHIAGADVPHFLLASTLGREPNPGWNTYRHGYIGAKHEGIIGFDTAVEPVAQPTVTKTVVRT